MMLAVRPLARVGPFQPSPYVRLTRPVPGGVCRPEAVSLDTRVSIRKRTQRSASMHFLDAHTLDATCTVWNPYPKKRRCKITRRGI